MTPQIDATDVAALTGAMSREEWCQHGMKLLAKGLVSLDPLVQPNDPNAFKLTETGVKIAKTLREQEIVHYVAPNDGK